MNHSDYNSLLRYIFDQHPDEEFPAECENLLHAYIEQELAGVNADLMYPQVKGCIDNSSAFRELYDSVKTYMINEQNDALIEPVIPEPDINFIRSLIKKPASNDEPKVYFMNWDYKETGQLIVHLRGKLHQAGERLLKNEQESISPGELLLAGSLMGEPNKLPHFQLKGTAKDIDVEIKTLPIEGDSESCKIAVQVNIPSRGGWPKLKNTRVSLSKIDESIQTLLTDPFGVVVFNNIPIEDLDYLMFEILPSN